MHPDSLIAYSMNGEKLTINHGFPLRAVIPGLVWHGLREVATLVEVRREDRTERNSAGALYQGDSITSHWRSSSGTIDAMNVKSALFASSRRGDPDPPQLYSSRGRLGGRESHPRSRSEYRWREDVVEGSVAFTAIALLVGALDVRLEDSRNRHVQTRRPSNRRPWPDSACGAGADRADSYEGNAYQRIQVTVVSKRPWLTVSRISPLRSRGKLTRAGRSRVSKWRPRSVRSACAASSSSQPASRSCAHDPRSARSPEEGMECVGQTLPSGC